MNENVKAYLDAVGVKTIKDLSDEQVLDYFLRKNKNTWLEFYAENALREFEKHKVISSMRKSMRDNIPFTCTYIVNESFGYYEPKEYGWILKP